MKLRSTITIPKSLHDIFLVLVVITVVAFFSMLAMLNVGLFLLKLPTANIFDYFVIIVAVIWLTLVSVTFWKMCREEGGLCPLFINFMGYVAGMQFAEIGAEDVPCAEIRFGFQLFGHRYIRHRIALDKIESVDWCSGQATDMAGRDMKDWHVCLWYDHGDPIMSRNKRQWQAWKPGQDLYIVGPFRRKKSTASFGLAFVDFLRGAGVMLVHGDKDACFVRKSQTAEMEPVQQSPALIRETRRAIQHNGHMTLFHEPGYLREFGPRLVMGALALLFGLMTATCLHILNTWTAATTIEKLFKSFALEALVSLVLLCSLALIWTMCAPKWIEQMFAVLAQRVLLTLASVIFLAAGFAWYMLTFR